MRLRPSIGHCSLLLALLAAAGCSDGGEAPEPLVDFHVDRKACSASCTVDRFDLFVLRGSCAYTWRVGLGGKEQTLRELELEPGTGVTVQVLGRCGSDACVRCEARQTFTLGSTARVDLKLKSVSGCASAKPVAAACATCLPTPDAYCDGVRRVTCPASGQSTHETCPNGCKGGECTGCTKKTFYQDKDGDTYGNSAVQTVRCTQPANSATRGGDCEDGNGKINPGQKAFFTTPTVSGGTSYDYNCDNKDEREYPKVEACAMDKSGNCVGAGWMALIPGCGKSGLFISCNKSAGLCTKGIPWGKTQACR
jgi:hypothetical protein